MDLSTWWSDAREALQTPWPALLMLMVLLGSTGGAIGVRLELRKQAPSRLSAIGVGLVSVVNVWLGLYLGGWLFMAAEAAPWAARWTLAAGLRLLLFISLTLLAIRRAYDCSWRESARALVCVCLGVFIGVFVTALAAPNYHY